MGTYTITKISHLHANIYNQTPTLVWLCLWMQLSKLKIDELATKCPSSIATTTAAATTIHSKSEWRVVCVFPMNWIKSRENKSQKDISEKNESNDTSEMTNVKYEGKI